MRNFVFAIFILLLAGCGTTDSTLQGQGRSESYIMGFHDGRHSGMREAGNHYEHFVQDRERYDTDDDYRLGWLAGEDEGKRIEAQADAIGTAAAAGVTTGTSHKHSKHPGISQETINEATRNVDPSVLKSLEK